LRPSVSDRPKVLAEIHGQPFLRLQLRWLAGQGIDSALLCLGHGADQVIAHFRGQPVAGMEVAFSVEPHPLGTAGALAWAAPKLAGQDELLVLNGDTFLDFDPAALRAAHARTGARVTVCALEAEDVSGKGVLRVDEHGRVQQYQEKGHTGQAGWINAGVYLMDGALPATLPAGPRSLERHVLTPLAGPAGGLYAHSVTGTFIDIGTPSDYNRALELLEPYARQEDWRR